MHKFRERIISKSLKRKNLKALTLTFQNGLNFFFQKQQLKDNKKNVLANFNWLTEFVLRNHSVSY
jgi:hypothetical protein